MWSHTARRVVLEADRHRPAVGTYGVVDLFFEVAILERGWTNFKCFKVLPTWTLRSLLDN